MPAARIHEILLPVKSGFIVITLAAALMLNLLPWTGWGLTLSPDFVAVTLLYWCIHQPQKVGIGAAWFMGLFSDVAGASLFGQHALAYSVLAFSALFLTRRVLMFNIGQQVLHIIPMLLLMQAVMAAVRIVAGAAFPGWLYFFPSISGALLWPLLSVLLELARKTPPVDSL